MDSPSSGNPSLTVFPGSTFDERVLTSFTSPDGNVLSNGYSQLPNEDDAQHSDNVEMKEEASEHGGSADETQELSPVSDSSDEMPNNAKRRRRSQSMIANKRIHQAFQEDEGDEDWEEEEHKPKAKRRYNTRSNESFSEGDDEPFEVSESSALEDELSDSEDSFIRSVRSKPKYKPGTRRSTRLRNRRSQDEEESEEEHRPILRERTSRINYSVPLAFPPVDEMDGDPSSQVNQSRSRKTHSELAITKLLRQQVSSFMPYIDSSGSESESDNTRIKKSSAKTIKALTDPANSGGPPDFGRIKEKSDLADSDPLGVDSSLSFESVGGLDNYINQLKEMVMLPLLYPEIFQRFNMQPPRGVLFHGPPGTGKTLMARALAAACSSENKKVSFYMRKGADCLSKWVGEAERQLRLLFEEAKSTQPSIIFFDEIDGLAPVRSSKQEQIHASIVSTLLALMDGMESRGQVIIIGATNRPDAVDPALRRPGRFDREFYFPLPDRDARKKIIEIHTRNWDPPVPEWLCSMLAEKSKGYGGADLRALCTEAALNSIKRTYPQLYRSTKRLQIDPKTIKVKVKDFVMSMKRMVPSSERSSISPSKPLSPELKPLLNEAFQDIEKTLQKLMPVASKLNPLEEVMYDDPKENDFEYQQRLETFETLRIYKPRFLICGRKGLGQTALGPAILQQYEGVHVQSFDMSTLLQDSTQSIETSIIHLFLEVRRHTPSIIYIPDIDNWLNVLPLTAITTFSSMLERLDFSDQILFLALSSSPLSELHPQLREWFSSKQSVYSLQYPTRDSIIAFFQPILELIKASPTELPGGIPRKRRVLPELPLAPDPPPFTSQKITLKQTKQADMRLLNKLKIKLNALLGSLRARYRKFKKPLIDFNDIYCVDPETGHSYRSREECHYEFVDDVVKQIGSDQKFSMMSLEEIEKRTWDNCYCTPKQFVHDIKLILRDALQLEDSETIKRAQEMYANVLLGVEDMEDDQFSQRCERMALREAERRKLRHGKLQKHLDETKADLQFTSEKPSVDESITEVDDAIKDGPPVLTETLTNSLMEDVGPENVDMDIEDNEIFTNQSTMSVPSMLVENEESPKPDEYIDQKDKVQSPLLNGKSPVGVPSEAALRVSTDVSTNISSNGRADIPVDTLITSPADVPNNAPTDAHNITSADGHIENIEQEVVFPDLVFDENRLTPLKQLLIDSTTGFTVDQLLHLHSFLYQIIWNTKSEWNRNSVVDECERAVKEFMINALQ